jgi:hypothetical protein
VFAFRKMPKSGPRPTRNDSDPPSSLNEFPGLERLDRPELDDEAPDTQREPWDDESAVRKLAKQARTA